MKFGHTKRETDGEPRNFHPGPGHYEIVEYRDIFDQIDSKKAATTKNQHSSWGSSERFNDKQLKKGSLGPGEYIGIQEWTKPNKNPKTVSTFDVEPRKVLTIPSIPSQSQSLGYQETSDGLFVMIQNPKAALQGAIGPGTYQAKKDFLKPKSKVYSFSKLHMQPSQKQDSGKNLSEFGPDVYSVSKIPGPFPESPAKGAEDIVNTPKRIVRRKPHFPAASKKDFSIEVEKFEYPGPGHYYNEQIFSCFKERNSLSPNMPCFSSKEQRFSNLLKNTELPGPGEYNIEKAQDFITLKTPALGFIGTDRFAKSEEKILPGPGSYELKSIFQENSANENFIKQLIVDKPPAFGTSTKRFAKKAETILETPGPGYYNLSTKTKKKSKKIIRLLNPTALLSEEEEQQGPMISFRGRHEGNSGLNKLLTDLPKGHRPYYESETSGLKGSGGAGSYFKSQTKRFLSSAGVSSLGPGSYEVPNENFKNVGFNQQKDISSKSNRIASLNRRDKDSLGPGIYNPKVDLIYPHKFSVKMTADPKYEPKFSLLGY